MPIIRLFIKFTVWTIGVLINRTTDNSDHWYIRLVDYWNAIKQITKCWSSAKTETTVKLIFSSDELQNRKYRPYTLCEVPKIIVLYFKLLGLLENYWRMRNHVKGLWLWIQNKWPNWIVFTYYLQTRHSMDEWNIRLDRAEVWQSSIEGYELMSRKLWRHQFKLS